MVSENICIIVLFFQEHGLTLTEVMILQSIYSFSVALFEIPSGFIADVFGRKRTIILSTIFTFIGFLVFFLSSFLQTLGASQKIPVVLAAWSPAMIAFLLGLSVMMNIEDG